MLVGPGSTRRSTVKAYDGTQLAAAMGWTKPQFADARTMLLLPKPDVSRPQRLGPRWSPTVVRGLLAARDALTADLHMGVLGAYRLAEEMTKRLGVDVNSSSVVELSRMGRIPRVGEYKGHAVYAVWAAVRFADLPALAQASVSSQQRTTDEVMRVLDVRRSDVNHLLRLRWLRPVRMADNPYPYGGGPIAVFRHGDLAALLRYDGIDWDAVRSTPRGRRSPLATLGVCEADARTALEQISRGLINHQLGHRQWAAHDRAAALDCWRTAGDHAAAVEHLRDVAAGDDRPVLRCAAWMALLPPDRAALV